MTSTSASIFYWSDWRGDPGLRVCSYAARGLWMDMLAIAADSERYGHVEIAGKKCTAAMIAKATNGTEEEVALLLAELEEAGVFSRTRGGVIYSRRMQRTAKNRANGKLGGNPNLLNKKTDPDPVNQVPKPPYPTHNPTQKDSKKEAINGNVVGKMGKGKPRNRQVSKSGRIWLDKGTPEFEQYVADYWEKHHAPVPLLWHESGAWFNLRGE